MLSLPLSYKTILKYLELHVFPPAVGLVTTWLVVHVKILGTLGVTHDAIASAILAVVIFAVTAGLSALVQHKVLTGAYAPVNNPTVKL